MTELALIRHGPTDWNAEKRLQGRADRHLSAAGREVVAGWVLPPALAGYDWVASPLCRARETAEMLGLTVTIEPAIIEMDWGAWEGATLDELRRRYGAEYDRRTAKGLDFRPHGGESPRAVRARVGVWMKAIAAGGRATGAVTHQGVIRAALSLATGWEMLGKPPERMDWAAAHLFEIAEGGAVTVQQMNISLEKS
jgi:broad specificity phosphatase PhoE